MSLCCHDQFGPSPVSGHGSQFLRQEGATAGGTFSASEMCVCAIIVKSAYKAVVRG